MNAPHTKLTDHESDFLTAALHQQEYPPALLAARRKAFQALIHAHNAPIVCAYGSAAWEAGEEKDETLSQKGME